MLAQDQPHLLETEVLEVYNEISLHHDKGLSVELTKYGKRAKIVQFVDDGHYRQKQTSNLNLKLVDMGGHQEYYSSSSLFISSTGVFLIAFDSSILKDGDIDKVYFSSVGTYIDLIWQTTTEEDIQPKLALVATKMDLSNPLEKHFQQMLKMTKDHVTSIKSE